MLELVGRNQESSDLGGNAWNASDSLDIFDSPPNANGVHSALYSELYSTDLFFTNVFFSFFLFGCSSFFKLKLRSLY